MIKHYKSNIFCNAVETEALRIKMLERSFLIIEKWKRKRLSKHKKYIHF